MTGSSPPFEVAIVGAGPIGLELAIALKLAGISYVQFDSGQVGQTITWFPHQARFFSSPERIAIAGVPLVTVDQSKATREDYLAYLRGVVQLFDLHIHSYEPVRIIKKKEAGFVIRTQPAGNAREYHARRIVLATGDMAWPRMLNIPGEDLPHVSHYFTEPHPYFQKQLLIVGGRNSTAEAALRCHRAGAKVAISYRGERFDPKSIKYWLLPELEHLIKTGAIAFYPRTVPTGITAGNPGGVTLTAVPSDMKARIDLGQTSGADLPRAAGNEPTHTVPADFVLLLTGYVADQSLMRMLGVELSGENQFPAFNPQTMETNIPGVFVAGTAAAGTQKRFTLFIETAHVHVERILRAITGKPGEVNERTYAHPES